MADNNNKRALLIGINKYVNLEPRYQLYGCVNDVEVVEGLLRGKFGFQNITLLLDQQATQQGIRAAMEQFIGSIMPDDIVVLHYSGHGSQVTDIHNDAPSGKDSTIVPHDSGRLPNPNLDITDYEIHAWLARMVQVTRNVTLIFDCCHSGSITRDIFGDGARWVEPDNRSAAEVVAEMGSPPVGDTAIANLGIARRDLGSGGSGWLALGQGYLLIAGCRDQESSYEHPVSTGSQASKQGALTYFLSRELAAAGSGTTYRDVFESVSTLVTTSYPRQHPQIEGRQDLALFGTEEIPTLQFIPVTARNSNTVTLGGGAALGLTVGSQWAIYPQGAKHVADGTAKLGLIEITAVRATSSDAKILDPDHSAEIKAGCRAIEEAHSYGEMRLVVDMASAPAGYEAQVDQLAKRIAQSPLLRVHSADESIDSADVRAYLIPPRSSADEGDPMPQLGAIAATSWGVVDRSGRRAMPIHPISENNVQDVLVTNLEKIARYRNALALKHPNSALKDKLGFKLRRQRSDGTWEDAQPDPASGQIIFESDDRIAFEIVNRHSAPIYISVLDFGLTSGVSLIFPPNRASDKFEPNQPPVLVGERDEDEIGLYIPDTFADAGGTEVLKLFVTTSEADFTWLTQQGVRSVGAARSPFELLFETAYTGAGTRDVRPLVIPAQDEWATVERPFFLRQKAGL
jgi:hypothetical protein